MIRRLEGKPKDMLVLYPNPAAEELTFKFTLEHLIKRVKTLDMHGKELISLGGQSGTPSTKSLNSGTYLIEAQTTGGKWIRKIKRIELQIVVSSTAGVAFNLY